MACSWQPFSKVKELKTSSITFTVSWEERPTSSLMMRRPVIFPWSHLSITWKSSRKTRKRRHCWSKSRNWKRNRRKQRKLRREERVKALLKLKRSLMRRLRELWRKKHWKSKSWQLQHNLHLLSALKVLKKARKKKKKRATNKSQQQEMVELLTSIAGTKL